MRGVVLLLLVLMLIPSVSADPLCTYSTRIFCDVGSNNMCDYGEEITVGIYYENNDGEACDQASEGVLNLGAWWSTGCKMENGETMAPVTFDIPFGLLDGDDKMFFDYTLDEYIPKACQGMVVNPSAASILIEGFSVEPTVMVGNFILGTNTPIAPEDVEIEIESFCEDDGSGGKRKCDILTDPCVCEVDEEFRYVIKYPKQLNFDDDFETREHLFDVISPVLTNGSDICKFSEIEEQGSPQSAFTIYKSALPGAIWDGSCGTSGTDWECSTKKKNFPQVTSECSNETMFIVETNLYEGNTSCISSIDANCVKSGNKKRFAGLMLRNYELGEGIFRFPEAPCKIESLTIDDSECTEGRLGNRCKIGDEISATVKAKGLDCGLADHLILYTGDEKTTVGDVINLSDRASGPGVDEWEFSTDGLVTITDLSFQEDEIDIPITRVKGIRTADGSVVYDGATWGIIRKDGGPCVASEYYVPNQDQVGDAYIAPGWRSGGDPSDHDMRLLFGQVTDAIGMPWTSNNLAEFNFLFETPRYCAVGDNTDNYSCQPGEETMVFFALKGDCSEVETTEIEFSFMDGTPHDHASVGDTYPIGGAESWSNGISAANCFPTGVLRSFRDEELWKEGVSIAEQVLNPYTPSPTGTNSLLDPLAHLSIKSTGEFIQVIPSIPEECQNQYVWAENLTLLDNESNVVLEFTFSHHQLGIAQNEWAHGSYFLLGDRAGNDTERYCGPVYDDSLPRVKLLNQSCYTYVDSSGDPNPINTWTALELTGKCPTEDYCLWHDGPDSEGQELPLADSESFWASVKCVAPGETVISNHFGLANPVELECMGRQPNGNERRWVVDPFSGIGDWVYDGDPKFVNPFCPSYGGVGSDWVADVQQGWCVPIRNLCDQGISSAVAPKHVGSSELDTIHCDQPLSEMLLDNSTGGLAERCFRSGSDLDELSNDANAYPKYGTCCPLIKIPVPTDEGVIVYFTFFDTQGVIIY